MYVSIVIVVGRLIRTLFTHSPTDVMVTEIPNPDFLLKICLDIYLVREAKDFFLEQVRLRRLAVWSWHAHGRLQRSRS